MGKECPGEPVIFANDLKVALQFTWKVLERYIGRHTDNKQKFYFLKSRLLPERSGPELRLQSAYRCLYLCDVEGVVLAKAARGIQYEAQHLEDELSPRLSLPSPLSTSWCLLECVSRFILSISNTANSLPEY